MAKRILIADDSVTIQRAFAMTFAAEDVTLAAARSADEGLNLARHARPDLVIADAVMPGRSGYDLCAALKGDPGLRSVPVYILASSQNPYDELRGRQSGADGNFIKPFDSTALIERVAEAIARGSGSAAGAALGGSGPTAAAAPRPMAPAVTKPTPAPAPGVFDDSDYGEITIENPESRPAAPAPRAVPAAATPARAPAAAPPSGGAAPGGGMRPSLIPGLRPGSMPPARPGTLPVRPVAAPAAAAPAPAVRPPAPSAPASAASLVNRTMVGMVPAGQQPVARSGVTAAPVAPVRPVSQPVRPLGPAVAPPGAAPHAPVVVASPSLAATVSSLTDQKMAALAARGPEYEAIAKLSREIIEKVVWEVVPELAEAIVREELQKRGRI